LSLLKKFLFTAIVFILPIAAVSGGDASPAAQVHFLNDRSKQIVGADLLGVLGFVTPAGLTGKGQVIAMADSGVDKGSIDDIHPDLAGEPGKKTRIIMLKSWAGRPVADDPLGHGTHMVGTIVGSGKSSGGKFSGVAPDASVYFQGILDESGKISPPADIETLFLPAYQAGARIHVNAWGSGADSYSGNAAKTDSFMRRFSDFLVIFGAGNAGPAKGSLTPEANSKNALVVGSSLSPRPALDFSTGTTLDTAQFSSRGPAGDGRIKPDLLAPGTSIISARSSLVKGNMPEYPEYTRMQGTSMAAAVVAGSAALLREYMQKYMALSDPMSASVKAALINGARTGEAGPSGEGFGVLDLAGTVLALKEESMTLVEEKGGLLSGGSGTYKYVVNNSNMPFKATVAWTDPAGDISAQSKLVNNLDLTVTAPDGKTYTGNSFTGRTPDVLNNVEQVYINNPLPGEYTIRVSAVSVSVRAVNNASEPRQDYSVVYGQPVETGVVESISASGEIRFYGGGSVPVAGKKILSLAEGQVMAGSVLEPGCRVYCGRDLLYVTVRQWSPGSVQSREGLGGRIWYEVNRDVSTGGYYQSPAAEKGVNVNGDYMEDVSGLPAGTELQADIDGVTQTLYEPAIRYFTQKGSVERIVRGEKGGIEAVKLFNDNKEYRLSADAGFIYNDNYDGSDPLETVFGSGSLSGLEKIMPGQQVTLVISPALNKITAVLIDRDIISGYAADINCSEGKITIGKNKPLQVLAGAGVQRDGKDASLKDISPGDHVVAVTLPGSGEILGLAARSNVVYGRVLFTSATDNIIYMADSLGRFQALKLSSQAEVRRWGLIADVSTLPSGTWVRATLSPGGENVVRLEIADLLEDQQKELLMIDGPYLVATDGSRYRMSDVFTAFTKNGLPVTAGDLKAGEKITIVSLLAPAPYSRVSVAVRATMLDNADTLIFTAGVRENGGVFELSGYTSGDSLYIWHENGVRESVPLKNGHGVFAGQLKFTENESAVKIVSLDGKTGAIAGKTITREELTGRTFSDISGHWAEKIIKSIAAKGVMAGYGDGAFRPDTQLTGAELSSIIAGLSGLSVPGINNIFNQAAVNMTRAAFLVVLNSVVKGSEGLPQNYIIGFPDCDNVTEAEREAIAWAQQSGIIKGRPGNIFAPGDLITRAEAAVIIEKILTLGQ